MYGKIFESMYEGTLYGKWQAIVAFQQMIVLSDPDGIVDMMPSAIAARTSIPLEIIEKGIAFLEEPDDFSRTPGFEGRRIVRLDERRPWGWRIVNHAYYRDLACRADRRENARERKRRQREREAQATESKGPSRPVTPRHNSSRKSRYAESDSNTGRGRAVAPHASKRCPVDWKPSDDLLTQMHTECPAVDLQRELTKFRDCEFPRAKKDWPAAFRTWIRRSQEGLEDRGRATKNGKNLEEQLLALAPTLGAEKRRDESTEAFIARLDRLNQRRIERLNS